MEFIFSFLSTAAAFLFTFSAVGKSDVLSGAEVEKPVRLEDSGDESSWMFVGECREEKKHYRSKKKD